MASPVRIYQARLHGCILLEGEYPEGCPSRQTRVVRRHFEVFHAAVNYYVLALAALETRSEGGFPVAALRHRLAETWEPWTDSRGILRPGLRQLCATPLATLKGGPMESLKEALALLAPEAGVPDRARHAALDLLLAKCGGEGAIQQEGRSYLPRFCRASANPTWDFSASADASEAGYQRLQALVHGAPEQEEMEAFAREMGLDWAGVKLEPKKFRENAEAQARIRQAVKHFEGSCGKRQQALIASSSDAWRTVKERVEALEAAALKVPSNRKAALDLTNAVLLFKYAPCDLTRALLACSVKAPAKSKGASGKEAQEGKPAVASKGDALRAVAEAARELGDDPIRICRGLRGYVFPAFTALADWAPEAPGEPVWLEFDIAAFKAALLTLNQFNLKTAEREDRRAQVAKILAWMEGTSTDLDGTAFRGEGAGQAPPVLGKDVRWPRLKNLLEQEMAIEVEEGSVGYTLRSRTLRGFSKLRSAWERELEKREGRMAPEDLARELEAELRKQQKEEASTMGSAPLLKILCRPEHWDLWRRDLGYANDALLGTHADYLAYQEEQERLKAPIRFTPADAVHSPRSYDFSGIAGKATATFQPEQGLLDVTLAVPRGGRFAPERARLRFTAPRLERDGIQALAAAKGLPWYPPVLAGLGFKGSAVLQKEAAVNLMPHPDQKKERNRNASERNHEALVLNIPVTLDVEPLQKALGRTERWRYAFNTSPSGEYLHLLWPGTHKPTNLDKAWWLDPAPFRVLSADLGQRTAAATARLRVKPGAGRWELGFDGTRCWSADLEGTGVLRLPGEDSMAMDTRSGQLIHEKDGRSATPDEVNETQGWIRHLAPSSETFELEGRSLPQLNDLLLVVFRRAQGRLRQNLRWAWLLSDSARQEKGLKELQEQTREPEWVAWAEKGETARLVPALQAAIRADQQAFPATLVQLAQRIAPQRDQHWRWASEPTRNVGFCLKLEKGGVGESPRIRGQRGLSMARLEQLDELRRRCQAMNRLMLREPGSAPPKTSEIRSQPMPEPCQPLLDKLDELKRQRVNQTAHLILVEALGLRQRTSTWDRETRLRSDQHGEYEPIPGREPVDLIVMEDLSRYTTSQGRGRDENARLMKWCHRAITDKVRELCEPFGIPVITVSPSYSSKFDSRSGLPGFRAVEVHQGDRRWWRRELEMAKTEPESAWDPLTRTVHDAFHALDIYELRRGGRQGKAPLTLLLPRKLGPIFVPVSFALDGHKAATTQADLNAAINLGLRALAAPGIFAIHSRIRVEAVDATTLKPICASKVEKARFKEKDRFTLPLPEGVRRKQEEIPDELIAVPKVLEGLFAGQTVSSTTRTDLPALVPARVLWGRVKRELAWKAVATINAARIEQWKTRLGVPNEAGMPF